ncbi:C-CAP/cofactor C-like domain-containing protein [Pseudoscourfieldia marina]
MHQAEALMDVLSCVLPNAKNNADATAYAASGAPVLEAEPFDVALFLYIQTHYKPPENRAWHDDVWVNSNATTTSSPTPSPTKNANSPSPSPTKDNNNNNNAKLSPARTRAEVLEAEDAAICAFVAKHIHTFLVIVSGGVEKTRVQPHEVDRLALVLRPVAGGKLSKCLASVLAAEDASPKAVASAIARRVAAASPASAPSDVNGVRGTVVVVPPPSKPATSLRISDCEDCTVYALGAYEHVSVARCKDAVVVVGAVGGVLRADRCVRLELHAASRRLMVGGGVHESRIHASCESRPPLLCGENLGCTFGPHAVIAEEIAASCASCGLAAGDPKRRPAASRWSEAVLLNGLPALKKAASRISPDAFTPHLACVTDPGKENAPLYALEKEYANSLESRAKAVASVRAAIANADVDEANRYALREAVAGAFREWLHTSGSARKVHELVRWESCA